MGVFSRRCGYFGSAVTWKATVRGLRLTAFLLVFAGGVSAAQAQPGSDWDRWRTHDAESTAVVDHDKWDQFLITYVIKRRDGRNVVYYEGIFGDGEKALFDYINVLAESKISQYNRNEQLAFWVNLYNALSIHLIIDGYPAGSMRDRVLPPQGKAGPWDRQIIQIENQILSANDIEHRILRPIWQDPRIHYALTKPAVGNPMLRRSAFRGGTVQYELDQAARQFINGEHGLRIRGKRLTVSSLYVWYKADFGGSDEGVIQHLRQYAEPDLLRKLTSMSQIAEHKFDWRINHILPRKLSIGGGRPSRSRSAGYSSGGGTETR